MPEITPGFGVGLRRVGDILIAEKALPDKFEIHIDVTIPEGDSHTQSVELPYNRLYGVYVGTTGLLPDQAVSVRLSDDTIRYSANFTEALQEDTSQAWYFRDSTGEYNMNIEIENTSPESVDVVLTIVMEPF